MSISKTLVCVALLVALVAVIADAGYSGRGYGREVGKGSRYGREDNYESFGYDQYDDEDDFEDDYEEQDYNNKKHNKYNKGHKEEKKNEENLVKLYTCKCTSNITFTEEINAVAVTVTNITTTTYSSTNPRTCVECNAAHSCGIVPTDIAGTLVTNCGCSFRFVKERNNKKGKNDNDKQWKKNDDKSDKDDLFGEFKRESAPCSCQSCRLSCVTPVALGMSNGLTTCSFTCSPCGTVTVSSGGVTQCFSSASSVGSRGPFFEALTYTAPADSDAVYGHGSSPYDGGLSSYGGSHPSYSPHSACGYEAVNGRSFNLTCSTCTKTCVGNASGGSPCSCSCQACDPQTGLPYTHFAFISGTGIALNRRYCGSSTGGVDSDCNCFAGASSPNGCANGCTGSRGSGYSTQCITLPIAAAGAA